jgi:cytochrome c oxidase cbb3-type subunit 3
MRGNRRENPRDELLDHDADGIREFDNALPRWWLYGFYLTIAFAGVYMVNYHVLPTPLWGKAGMVAEYEAELQAAPRPLPMATANGVKLAVLSDQASLAEGRQIFDGPSNVCASCHRPDLGGLIGPDLTDDYWRHGCSIESVVASVKVGYPQKGMLPFGTGKPLDDEQVLKVASYILSKRGSGPANPKPTDASDVMCR